MKRRTFAVEVEYGADDRRERKTVKVQACTFDGATTLALAKPRFWGRRPVVMGVAVEIEIPAETTLQEMKQGDLFR